jgi:pimeloyl-ACP methyl ester carboxylesterase
VLSHRRILAGLLATVLVVAVGCHLPPAEPDAEAGRGSSEQAGEGRSVDIGGGRSLFVQCRGTGRPTVILESGIHDSSEYWASAEPIAPAIGPDVYSAVAAHTRVCRYDRPGTIIPGDAPSLTDRSTPVSNPRTVADTAADLEALIVAAGLEGPFVLVGHSFGGWLQTYFAQTHADQVAGLVLVDAVSARMPEFFGPRWPAYEKVLNFVPGALGSDPASERFDVLASVALADRAPKLRSDLPMAVISKTEPFPLPADVRGFTAADLERTWRRTQAALAALVPNTPHVVAEGSDHYIQVREPDLVTATIVLVLDRARQRR